MYSYSWGKRTLRAICQAKGDLSHDGLLEFNDSYISDEDEDVYAFFGYQGGQDRDDVAPGPDEAHEDLLVFANELLYDDPTFYRKTLSHGYRQWWGEASNKEDNVEEKKKCRSGSHHFYPSKVEFLGNGGCSPGRWYSRAALVLWPKQHRKLVRETTHGALREAQDIENGERAEARKAKALAGVAGAVVQAAGAGQAAAAGAKPAFIRLVYAHLLLLLLLSASTSSSASGVALSLCLCPWSPSSSSPRSSPPPKIRVGTRMSFYCTCASKRSRRALCSTLGFGHFDVTVD
jgi:hypothetical protein